MREQSKQTALRSRVERGIFRRAARDDQTRYDVSYLDSDGRQRWRTAGTLGEARRLRAPLPRDTDTRIPDKRVEWWMRHAPTPPRRPSGGR